MDQDAFGDIGVYKSAGFLIVRQTEISFANCMQITRTNASALKITFYLYTGIE